MSRKHINNPNHCPMVHAMNIIGNKWTSIIIYILSEKTLRFGELDFRINNISRKVLTEQLKELEIRGVILRVSHPESPPRVEYSLTEKGKQLIPILDQLCEWGKDIIVKDY